MAGCFNGCRYDDGRKYIFVLILHYKIVDEVGGSKPLLAVNTFILFVIFGGLLYYQWQSDKTVLFGTAGIIAGALILESLYRKFLRKSFSVENKTE